MVPKNKDENPYNIKINIQDKNIKDKKKEDENSDGSDDDNNDKEKTNISDEPTNHEAKAEKQEDTKGHEKNDISKHRTTNEEEDEEDFSGDEKDNISKNDDSPSRHAFESKQSDEDHHPIPKYAKDDEILEYARKYRSKGKVVLDFSHGNDAAKVIVYKYASGGKNDNSVVGRKASREIKRSIISKFIRYTAGCFKTMYPILKLNFDYSGFSRIRNPLVKKTDFNFHIKNG